MYNNVKKKRVGCMTDSEKSRKFWEKVIATIIVLMFVGVAYLLYSMAMMLERWGIEAGSVASLLLQIIFMGFIVYLNKSFRDELDRRLPLPKRNNSE